MYTYVVNYLEPSNEFLFGKVKETWKTVLNFGINNISLSWFGLAVFYGISTLVGYSISN